MPFLKFMLTFYFLANSSYSLHLIKLKLDMWLDHDVEQRGYSLPLLLSTLLTIPIKTSSLWLTSERA